MTSERGRYVDSVNVGTIEQVFEAAKYVLHAVPTSIVFSDEQVSSIDSAQCAVVC